MRGNRTFNALPQLFHCLHKSQEIHLASRNPCKCETKGPPSSTVPKQPHLERRHEMIIHKTCDITWRFWRILAVRLPPYTAIASLLRQKPMRHSQVTIIQKLQSCQTCVTTLAASLTCTLTPRHQATRRLPHTQFQIYLTEIELTCTCALGIFHCKHNCKHDHSINVGVISTSESCAIGIG